MSRLSQPVVLVRDAGEPGRRRHGSVSCSSQYYGIARADVSGAGQDPGVRAADVLHEDWETIQGVTYYYDCLRTYTYISYWISVTFPSGRCVCMRR